MLAIFYSSLQRKEAVRCLKPLRLSVYMIVGGDFGDLFTLEQVSLEITRGF